MALWFNLNVNRLRIGSFGAQRIAGSTHPDSIGTYKVEIDGSTFELEHRYGDGAWELVRNALDKHVGTQPS